MADGMTLEERLARLEEQVKTLFATSSRTEAGVNKILDRLQNGKVHQVRLDDHDREFERMRSGFGGRKEEVDGLIRELGAQTAARLGTFSERIDSLDRFRSLMIGMGVVVATAASAIALVRFIWS